MRCSDPLRVQRSVFVFSSTAVGPLGRWTDGKRWWSDQIDALGPWRAPYRVLGGSVPLGWNRAYSGVRFTKAEAVGTLSRRPRRVLPWLVRLLDLFQQRL